MAHRVVQRIACAGSIKLPALPSMVDWYVELCQRVFAASGRGFAREELAHARRVLLDALGTAFAASNRSKIEIRFEAEPARPLGFTVCEDRRSLADAYERWIDTGDGPLFGAHADARVLSLVEAISDPATRPVLDFGAGTGRNAFALARRGHPVDAVEITPRFADMLRQTGADLHLPMRVIAEDVFRDRTCLRHDYWMLLASEVVPDFRSVDDLRRLFELARTVLVPGGLLVFNVHVCALGFTPEKAARELAQQCYSCLFTPSEVAQAAGGLPFALAANDSVHDYERSHLSPDAWPPTPWYVNWTTGRDVYEIESGTCPVEMRWLVFERLPETRDAMPEVEPSRLAPFDRCGRIKFDTVALRRAVELRLLRRTSSSGMLCVPALPGFRGVYADMCRELLSALGRGDESSQVQSFQTDLARMLDAAFERSQRSNVVITYEAPIGKPLHYTVTADAVPLSSAYEQWHDELQESLFGERPDARLEGLVDSIEAAQPLRAADLGAGLGRNAVWLARRGFTVDALELCPRFAEALRRRTEAMGLAIRVICGNFFETAQELDDNCQYQLVLASGVAGDLRGRAELRRLFEIAAQRLGPGGHLLISLHVTSHDYSPDDVAQQWAEQCCATLYTPSDIERCLEGLPLIQESDESAFEYERSHRSGDSWPPNPAFVEWASGLHLAAIEPDRLPLELRWRLYRRS